jgi:DNA-binding transcriptional ArsR family regulator
MGLRPTHGNEKRHNTRLLILSNLHSVFRRSCPSSDLIHYHMVVDRLDTTFAALSDPTRRAMIQRLSRGPASVHGLTEPFALSQQMISKHIAYLVRARIVIKTKRGRESVCTLRPEAIKTVSDWAISYRRFWEESFDKLDVVVNQMKKAEVRNDKKHG